MLLLGPPPSPPAAVLFEESMGPLRSGTFSHEWVTFVDASLAEITQVTIVDDVVYTTRVNPATRAAELLSIHTSLNKKARHERMSAFEREYPW
jgi:hypothetical protein